jgi:hypothetical protein
MPSSGVNSVKLPLLWRNLQNSTTLCFWNVNLPPQGWFFAIRANDSLNMNWHDFWHLGPTCRCWHGINRSSFDEVDMVPHVSPIKKPKYLKNEKITGAEVAHGSTWTRLLCKTTAAVAPHRPRPPAKTRAPAMPCEAAHAVLQPQRAPPRHPPARPPAARVKAATAGAVVQGLGGADGAGPGRRESSRGNRRGGARPRRRRWCRAPAAQVVQGPGGVAGSGPRRRGWRRASTAWLDMGLGGSVDGDQRRTAGRRHRWDYGNKFFSLPCLARGRRWSFFFILF